jgi:hypothetical protein
MFTAIDGIDWPTTGVQKVSQELLYCGNDDPPTRRDMSKFCSWSAQEGVAKIDQ